MIQRIKTWWKRLWQTKQQRKTAKARQKMYENLIYGLQAIRFIQNDLNKTMDNVNRHTRRRMQKSLKKAEITPEIVNYYLNNAEKAVERLNAYLNPPKKAEVKTNGEKI